MKSSKNISYIFKFLFLVFISSTIVLMMNGCNHNSGNEDYSNVEFNIQLDDDFYRETAARYATSLLNSDEYILDIAVYYYMPDTGSFSISLEYTSMAGSECSYLFNEKLQNGKCYVEINLHRSFIPKDTPELMEKFIVNKEDFPLIATGRTEILDLEGQAVSCPPVLVSPISEGKGNIKLSIKADSSIYSHLKCILSNGLTIDTDNTGDSFLIEFESVDAGTYDMTLDFYKYYGNGVNGFRPILTMNESLRVFANMTTDYWISPAFCSNGHYEIPNSLVKARTDYYIDSSTGDDELGSGSKVSPFKTIKAAQEKIRNNELKDFNLYIKRGTVASLEDPINVSSGCNVKVDSYGSSDLPEPVILRDKSFTYDSMFILSNLNEQEGCSLRLDNVCIDGNGVTTIVPGAGIRDITNGRKTELVLNNCVLKNHRTTDDGGALYVRGLATDVEITNCFIGAVDMSECATKTDNGNMAVNGAGICIQSANNIKIRDVFMEYNYAENNGGALCIPTGSMWNSFRLENISVYRNGAGNNGGGLSIFGSDEVKLQSSRICNNFCEKNGGGVYYGNGTVILNKSVDIKENENSYTLDSEMYNNLYLASNMKLKYDSESDDDSDGMGIRNIGITTESTAYPVCITENFSTYISDSNIYADVIFFSDFGEDRSSVVLDAYGEVVVNVENIASGGISDSLEESIAFSINTLTISGADSNRISVKAEKGYEGSNIPAVCSSIKAEIFTITNVSTGFAAQSSNAPGVDFDLTTSDWPAGKYLLKVTAVYNGIPYSTMFLLTKEAD